VLLFHGEITICNAVIIRINYVNVCGADGAVTTRRKRKSLEKSVTEKE
jgi:hypothetical protein